MAESMRDIRHYQREMKRMAKKFYDRPFMVHFQDKPYFYMRAEISVEHPQGVVTFVAPSWEDLRNYFRKLVNPASRI